MGSPFYLEFVKMNKKKKVLLLLDGDMVAFSHAAAEEYGKESEDVSFAKIQMSMESKVAYIEKRVGATQTIACISGKTNMRHVIAPSYKDNRKGVWRPENLDNAKAALITMYDGIVADGLEADDLIGILSRNVVEMDMGKRGHVKAIKTIRPLTKDDFDEVVIATLDKDMAQIGKSNPTGNGPVIKHYRWETKSTGEKISTVLGFGELKLIVKSKKKEVKGNGAKFFLWQLLTGDSTDGVMGCGVSEKRIYQSGAKCGQEYEKRVGVGAIEAFELLDKVTSYAEGLNIVATQYLLRFADGWKDELIKNGRLLYMSNAVDEGNKVRLWHYNPKIVEYFNLNTKQLISASA